MNTMHLHLALNHLPIIGLPLALLLLSWGILKKHSACQKAGILAHVFVGIMSVFVFLTGEPAEKTLLAYMQDPSLKDWIEKHESFAKTALIMTLLSSVIAAYDWKTEAGRLRKNNWLLPLLLFCSISGSIAWFAVGNSGGKIRHTEIRSPQPKISGQPNVSPFAFQNDANTSK